MGTTASHTSTAGAASPPAVVSFEVAPTVATVGDRIVVTIVVEHDDETSITGPGFGADFGGLEIVEITPGRDEVRGGSVLLVRTTLTYTLTSFHIGGVAIPDLAVAWRSADGGAGVVRTTSTAVRIESVLQAGDTSLRPLKPQLEIVEGAPPAIVPVLFVAMFAALTALGYVLHRRAIGVRPLPAPALVTLPEPRPTLHDVARARLDAIAAEGLGERDVPEYYARIALALRAYLSERFAFPAYAMTRTELERNMSRAGIERWPARLTANLLEQCDAAEFAGFRPAAERRAADLTAAYEIVDLTVAVE